MLLHRRPCDVKSTDPCYIWVGQSAEVKRTLRGLLRQPCNHRAWHITVPQALHIMRCNRGCGNHMQHILENTSRFHSLIPNSRAAWSLVSSWLRAWLPHDQYIVVACTIKRSLLTVKSIDFSGSMLPLLGHHSSGHCHQGELGP